MQLVPVLFVDRIQSGSTRSDWKNDKPLFCAGEGPTATRFACNPSRPVSPVLIAHYGCGWSDSNRRLRGYEPRLLTTELHRN